MQHSEKESLSFGNSKGLVAQAYRVVQLLTFQEKGSDCNEELSLKMVF